MNHIKQALKEPLINKRDYTYRMKLDSSVTLYDEWIQKAEDANKYEGECNTPRICIYDQCTSDFVFHEEDDFVVFTSDTHGMDSQAARILTLYLQSHPECILVYGDEDEVNSCGNIRMNPWFKPDFSPDTLLSFFYFGNVFAVRAEAARDIKWLGTQNGLLNIYHFCLQLCSMKNANQIAHINHVVFHSHDLKALCIGTEFDRARESIQNSLTETKETNKNEQVSIIIPSKDHPELLKNLIASIYTRTDDVSFEILVVDNGSSTDNRQLIEALSKQYTFRYLYREMPFNFARMCNLGAGSAHGDYLLFLNDDTEIRQSDWLKKLTQKASVHHVGAVGAKLYYPQSKLIQHAGITNLRLGPVHKLQFKEDKRSYYFHYNRYPVNVIAVTGACLMIEKERFTQVGGFDEQFEVAFNDVELCFRLYEAGYHNVVRNDVHLWHYESYSRGNDEDREKQERLAGERNLLYEKHPALYARDPYYHPYLCNDILDTNFSLACQYESARNVKQMEPVLFKKRLKEEWENECLILSVEYADSLERWIDIQDNGTYGIYFQGYAFVSGADNACCQKYLLLKHEESGQIYELPFNDVFRPDLEMNLDEREKALLCGFSIAINRASLPGGKYRVGVYAKDCCSRQRLYCFSGKYVTV